MVTQPPYGEDELDSGLESRQWWVFRDDGTRAEPGAALPQLPEPPPWRRFTGTSVTGEPLDLPGALDSSRRLGRPQGRTLTPEVLDVVNAAIHLRRPLLVTGRPGTGKSSLATQIAAELALGPVLSWPVVSRSTLKDGLYDYDAIGRVQDTSAQDSASQGPDQQAQRSAAIGRYLTLGPLGTALLPWRRPRLLLIDELDKSDIDLPNDLLHVFEEGEFRIRELERVAGQCPGGVPVLTADHAEPVLVLDGHIRCHEFPIVVITSNGERQFPPAFRRRCLELRMPDPDARRLAAMVTAHFGRQREPELRKLIEQFLEAAEAGGGLAADQLLNAVHMLSNGTVTADRADWTGLRDALWHSLSKDSPT